VSVVLTFPLHHPGGGNLQIGDTYNAPNGSIYQYDGYKWIISGILYSVSNINIAIDGGYPSSQFDSTTLTIDGGSV
jgi:hypothetical protein